jgi:hypothetical protein
MDEVCATEEVHDYYTLAPTLVKVTIIKGPLMAISLSQRTSTGMALRVSIST